MNALHRQMLQDFTVEVRPLLNRLAHDSRRLVRGLTVWLVTGNKASRRQAACARRRLAQRTVGEAGRALAAWEAIGVTVKDVRLHERNPALAILAEAVLFARKHSNSEGLATPEAEVRLWDAMYGLGY